MSKIFIQLILILICLISRYSFAQTNLYTFSQSAGTYSEIPGDTIVAFATSTNTNPGDLDNVIYQSNSLPFNFIFNGNSYGNIVISSNGFLTFGQQLPSSTNVSCISSNETYSGAIGVLSRDLIGTFGARCTRTISSNVLTNVSNFSGVVSGRAITGTGIPAGTTITSFDANLKTITMSASATSSSAGVTTTIQIASGSIVRSTTGSAGNRIHTIQWKNFRRFTTTDTLENFNFQIKLFETSNKIEVIYGHFAKSPVTPSISVQVGLRGALNSDFFNRTTSTDWTATAAGVNNISNCVITPLILPPSGLKFTWTPQNIFGDDCGIIAAAAGAPNQIISIGKSFDVSAIVKNFGLDTQVTIPVYYSVNGGAVVGPVSTPIPLTQNETDTIIFGGSFAFTPTVTGNNFIKVYTSLIDDQQFFNDTTIIQINVQPKIAVFPFVEKFSNPVNWTIVIEQAIGITPLWGYGVCTNPDGKSSDTAVSSNCYNGLDGRKEILRSPVFDISLLANPVANFYLAYRSFTGNQNDTLEILLSTDGGVNYISSTTVFNKGNSSVPSLATRNGQGSAYFPDSSIQWRHETLDLSNVQGSNNVIIGFRSKSNFGNRLWIDNLILSDDSTMCLNNINSIGQYSCDSSVLINFTSLGLSNSGAVSVQRYNADGNNGQGISINTNSTTQNGLVYTPVQVNQDWYYTVTFTGNDKNGFANYDISIDVSEYENLFDPATAYIMKRSDLTGKWACLNTTSAGSFLTAHGLKTFSDFSIGYPIQTFTINCRLELIKLSRTDTLTINFRNSFAPYSIKEFKKTVYDSLTGVTSGASSFILNDSSYYIEVKHRNSVNTWSATSVECTGNQINYDFTTGIGKAYDSNQVLVDGIACIYSGEVTQDACIDLSDINAIYNYAALILPGDYLITDLNYDGITDLTDIIKAYNNSSAFVCEKSPLLKFRP